LFTFCLSLKGGNRTRKVVIVTLKCVYIWQKCLKMGIEPMKCLQNGNRTHEFVNGVNWNHTTVLQFSNEFMTEGVNPNYSIVWVWESNQEPTQMWNRKPIQGVPKGTRTHDYVARLTRSNTIVRFWESNPWIMFCETKYWSIWLKYFFFFFFNLYTLVMCFFHYGAVIIAYYEAVHCLFGHHKFGWSSLHRCMRSV
jgi:hypothetical protein